MWRAGMLARGVIALRMTNVSKLLSTVPTPISTDAVVNGQSKILTVSLVGRPNTGKSTLFNRMTGSKKAIVSNIPGTTRDRTESIGYLSGLPLRVIDTGGLDDRGALIDDVVKQVAAALVKSDVILFMLDSRTGITSTDRSFASWVRETTQKLQSDRELLGLNPTKVILVANKTEGGHLSNYVMDIVSDSYSLGLGDPLLISASQGDGIGDLTLALLEIARQNGCEEGGEELLDSRSRRRLLQHTKEHPDVYVDEEVKHSLNSANVIDDLMDTSIDAPVSRTIQLAIMGKPNVGKSTLLNALVGEERVITGPTAGLTRDSITVDWSFQGRSFRLVDTAGLTRVRTQDSLLRGITDQKHQTLANSLGKAAAQRNITLPGIQQMDIEADPSQFSTQIAEMALQSALQTLKFANVVMLVVEAQQGQFSKVDLQLARKCLQEGRGVFIAANKVDVLLEKGDVSITQYEKQVRDHTAEYFREFGEVPVVACSGLDSRGLQRLLRTAAQVHDAWDRRISTGTLNSWLREASVTAPSAKVGDKLLKIKYVTQIKSRPPTFKLFCNATELPPFFERYFRHKIQHDFDLKGVPVRFVVTKSEGKEVKKHLLKHGKHSRRGTGRGEAKGKYGAAGKKRRTKKVLVSSSESSSGKKISTSQSLRAPTKRAEKPSSSGAKLGRKPLAGSSSAVGRRASSKPVSVGAVKNAEKKRSKARLMSTTENRRRRDTRFRKKHGTSR